MRPAAYERLRSNRRRVRAEAAAWITRLHGPSRTPAMEAGLRRWLAEDPRHAREFELATDVWNETGCGHTEGVPKRPPLARRPNLAKLARPIVAIAAAVLLFSIWMIQIAGRTAISTGVGEQKTVMLTDGSRITLNTDTALVVQYRGHSRTVTVKYGEAYFDVVHNALRPFVVRAGDRSVIDLGTRFMVNRSGGSGDSLTVLVVEGQVAVAPTDEVKISPSRVASDVHYVSAGQLLRFRANALPAIQTVPLDEATAWLNGQVIFNGTPLAEAAAQFNRYNAEKIKVISAQAAAIPVGGVFRVGDYASFARAVAESHHLTLITRGNELLLEPSGPLRGTSSSH